jgi:hypothetical protein
MPLDLARSRRFVAGGVGDVGAVGDDGVPQIVT